MNVLDFWAHQSRASWALGLLGLDGCGLSFLEPVRENLKTSGE